MSSPRAAILKTLIFTLLVPGTVAVGVPHSLVSSRQQGEIGGWGLVGLAPVLVGAALYLRCAWAFAVRGLGTPAPLDPPRNLVASGPYRAVRNPMYIGVVLVILGQAWLYSSWRLLAYGVAAWCLCHLFVVFHEEPTLRKKFGVAYEEYCQTTSRWFPRFRRR